jgi:hypothetical protein
VFHLLLDTGHLEVDALRGGFLSNPLRLPLGRSTDLIRLDLAVLQPAIEDRGSEVGAATSFEAAAREVRAAVR